MTVTPSSGSVTASEWLDCIQLQCTLPVVSCRSCRPMPMQILHKTEDCGAAAIEAAEGSLSFTLFNTVVSSLFDLISLWLLLVIWAPWMQSHEWLSGVSHRSYLFWTGGRYGIVPIQHWRHKRHSVKHVILGRCVPFAVIFPHRGLLMVPCSCEDYCHGNERISAIHCQHRSSFHSHVYSTVIAKDFVQLNHTIHRWTPHDNAWFLSWVNNAQESCDRIHSHTCFLLVIKTWQDTCNMSWQGLVTAHT